jgi:hypothetical protein
MNVPLLYKGDDFAGTDATRGWFWRHFSADAMTASKPCFWRLLTEQHRPPPARRPEAEITRSGLGSV